MTHNPDNDTGADYWPPEDAAPCMCSVWDEETSTMHRCMWRALDLGCCGKGGPCPCNPSNAIAANVANYATKHPGILAAQPAPAPREEPWEWHPDGPEAHAMLEQIQDEEKP